MIVDMTKTKENIERSINRTLYNLNRFDQIESNMKLYRIGIINETMHLEEFIISETSEELANEVALKLIKHQSFKNKIMYTIELKITDNGRPIELK